MDFKGYTNLAIRIILSLIVLLSLFSCREDAATTVLLREAETLMEAKPDRAYRLLQKADTTAFFSHAQRAEWNLRITQAMCKAYMKPATDSLIREATSYYEKQNDPDRLILAYYYMGKVSRDLGNAALAQEYYLKALDVKPSKTDNYLLGVINNQLGDLYTWQSVYDKALPYYESALMYMDKAGDQEVTSYILRGIGRVYSKQKEILKAISYYNKALEKANENSRTSILVELSDCYLALEDRHTALTYLKEALSSVNDSAGFYTTCLVLGKFYVRENELDSASYYLLQCEKSNQIATRAASLLTQMKIAQQKEEWKKYVNLHLKYREIEAKIVEIRRTGYIREVEERYQYELIQKDAEYRHLWNLIFLSLSCTLILLLLYILFRFIQHRRSSREKEEKWEKEYQDMLNDHHIKELKIKEDEKRIKELNHIIKSSASAINNPSIQEKKLLELNLNQIQNTKITKEEIDTLFRQTDIYKLFHNTINIGRITEENINELIREIDVFYPNFRTTIMGHLPSMKERDLQTCYLLKANIGSSVIGDLFSTSKHSASMRQNRLAKKIFQPDSGTEDLQKFIDSII